MEIYAKQNFKNGDIIEADSLNKIEDGIVDLQNFTLTKIDDMESGVYNTTQRALSDLVDENIENYVEAGFDQKLEEIQTNIELKALAGKKGDAEGSEIFNDYAHNIAEGDYSHAEGSYTNAIGFYSHAEGGQTTASGSQSHAEGGYTFALGLASHSEGSNTTASGESSHAEGDSTNSFSYAVSSSGSNGDIINA
jgi:hypothetical protein